MSFYYSFSKYENEQYEVLRNFEKKIQFNNYKNFGS